jgi:hypothetical protein
VILKGMSSLVVGEFVVRVGVMGGLGLVEGGALDSVALAERVVMREQLRSFGLLRTPQDDNDLIYNAHHDTRWRNWGMCSGAPTEDSVRAV